jgi:tRNA modification GTPase
VPFSTDDTIVAVATPPGRGGIGVVRLSGPEAQAIARTLTRRESPFEPRHATFCRILDGRSSDSIVSLQTTNTVDQVVVTWFAAPHSYTGDDVIEIAAHGSPVLLPRIVELAVGAGARLAEPGEFTLRAYLNGRMDLAQAEAVADLVAAVTPLQARAAMDQLEGTLTTTIAKIDASILDVSARLEASLDFPDEGFHFVTRDGASAELAAIAASLDALARDGRTGRVIREGRMVVIAGAPNAGKSSLFNALAGAARAIVTPVAGTTRDVLTETIDLDGVAVTLVDTAGLRESADPIEIEGVARARGAQKVAALTLVVIDRSAPIDARVADAMIREARASTPDVLVVWSKADLPAAAGTGRLDDSATFAPVALSAMTGEGLPALRAAIVRALTSRDDLRDPPAITNVRHLERVDAARESIALAIAALQAGATEELVIDDLVAARRALEDITGRRTPDDVLRHIFAKFCIGK